MRVEEGQGWRLQIDPVRAPFPVLIGGSDWAAELTLGEASLLQRALERLVAEHAAVSGQLLAEEAIDLELDLMDTAGHLWLSLAGDRTTWTLRFVLTPAPGQRAIEGAWDASASRCFGAALHQVFVAMVPAVCAETESHAGEGGDDQKF